MTLFLERINPVSEEATVVGTLFPGEQPGSLSQILPDGRRELYIFECLKDNASSSIRKSVWNVDNSLEAVQKAVISGNEEVVAELKEGESYTLNLTTEEGNKVHVRFTHR